MVSLGRFFNDDSRLPVTLYLAIVASLLIGARTVAAQARCLRVSSVNAKILLPGMVGVKCFIVAVISDTERTLAIYRASNILRAVYI